jgi:hypothetical protein
MRRGSLCWFADAGENGSQVIDYVSPVPAYITGC